MRYFTGIFVVLVVLAGACPCFALNVIWDRSGAGDSSRYGYSILPLGDQNNDGIADWAVFAAGIGVSGQDNEAKLEFFHGGVSPETAPYLTVTGAPGISDLLYVREVGDLNGDHVRDWYILKRYYSNPSRYSAEVYLGGSDLDSSAALTIAVSWHSELQGNGDFNGDGYDDLSIYDDDTGRNEVYFGGPVLDSFPDWGVSNNPPGYQNAAPLSFGDLNGDGFNDWIGVTGWTNSTYIFLGGSTPDTLPAYSWENLQYLPISIVKDLNGDGFDDLLFNGSPEVDVHFGATTLHSTPDAVLNFPCVTPLSAFSAGDFNHDGYNDLILLTDYCAASDWGVLSLYLGHPTLNRDPAITIVGWTNPLNLIGIRTAASLGDVNGDSVDDIAIGSWDDLAYLGWRGRAVIIAGDTTLRVDAEEPIILTPSSFSLSCFPNPFNATTTISFTLPKTGVVDLKVNDVTGRIVRVLIGRTQGSPLQEGEHRIAFDASDLPSGIYFVRMEAGGMTQTKKIVLLK
jgi:hypothetical protein